MSSLQAKAVCMHCGRPIKANERAVYIAPCRVTDTGTYNCYPKEGSLRVVLEGGRTHRGLLCRACGTEILAGVGP